VQFDAWQSRFQRVIQLFTIKRLEEFIPSSPLLRPMREMVSEALRRLDGLFERM